MPPGERSAIMRHRIGGLFDKGPVARDAILRLEVEIDARMHAAVAEMAVERTVVAGPIEQPAEVAKIIPDELRRHSRILPTRPSVVPAGYPGRRAEGGLADSPDQFLLSGIFEHSHVG